MARLREFLFLELVPKRNVAPEVIRRLSDGGMVVIMIDQAAGRGGRWVDFMGREASTVTSPALFALKTGAAVFSMFIVRDTKYNYRLIFEGPFDLISTGDIKSDVISNTRQFNRMLEQYVRRQPEHWFWIHRRWKPIPISNVARQYRRVQNILVCMPNWIGDIVMALPALEYLRRLFPYSRITLLVREHLADLVRENPHVDEVIGYRYRRDLLGQRENLKTIKAIRRKLFDLALIFPDSLRAALWMRLARVPARIGYAFEGRSMFLTHKIKKPDDMTQIGLYLNLTHALGEGEVNGIPRMTADEDSKKWAEEFLRRSGANSETVLIGLNPGASYGPAKCWPLENYAALGQRLLEDPRTKIVIFGGGDQAHVSDELEQKIGSRTLNLGGKTNLRQLAAMLERCAVVVSNDTGPMHMAAALGARTIAIFGSTDPWKTSPPSNTDVIYKEVECSPCFHRECSRDLACLRGITVDEVYRKIKEHL